MLTVQGQRQRLCDGSTRRDFLRAGALGSLSLAALDQARAEPRLGARAPSFGRARRCVLLFLVGGPPQHDTWDMKPEAPAEIRGELQPIETNVPGIRVSELFPQLARLADRYCLVRSVTHDDTVHTSAGYTMLTGVRHPLANAVSATSIRPRSDDHPHLGSLLARVRTSHRGMPPFVSLPETIFDDAVNEYPGQTAGFLGNRYAPFQVSADTQRAVFHQPEISLPAPLSVRRLETRRALLDRIDDRFRRLETGTSLEGLTPFYQRAFDLAGSSAAREAFDLGLEPVRGREAYGRHLFGQGCLMARRLLEAGVSLVTVYWHYEGPKDSPVWDTHQNNFRHLRERLVPPTDQACSALLSDLDARGMLDDTLLICMGEFGRTPKINSGAGRDHWPHAQSILLAGAGIPGGTVYGATDAHGAYPADQPVTPADLTATFLHLLGVPPDLEIRDQTDRPFKACEGTPVQGLLK